MSLPAADGPNWGFRNSGLMSFNPRFFCTPGNICAAEGTVFVFIKPELKIKINNHQIIKEGLMKHL